MTVVVYNRRMVWYNNWICVTYNSGTFSHLVFQVSYIYAVIGWIGRDLYSAGGSLYSDKLWYIVINPSQWISFLNSTVYVGNSSMSSVQDFIIRINAHKVEKSFSRSHNNSDHLWIINLLMVTVSFESHWA